MAWDFQRVVQCFNFHWIIELLQTIFALILFLFPLAYSPGPGNMFFAANGARFGFRATIPANAGYHVATWIVTVAIGYGFLAAGERFPHLFALLKVVGALYVLWIAGKMMKAGALNGAQDAEPATFIDGVLLLLLNPKAYIIITLMFTQFLGLSNAGMLASVLLIASVFTLNNLLAFLIWILLADTVASFFRSPDSARKLNLIFGAILVIVAIWTLFS